MGLDILLGDCEEEKTGLAHGVGNKDGALIHGVHGQQRCSTCCRTTGLMLQASKGEGSLLTKIRRMLVSDCLPSRGRLPR